MYTGGLSTISSGLGGVSSFTFPYLFPLVNLSPIKGFRAREVLVLVI